MTNIPHHRWSALLVEPDQAREVMLHGLLRTLDCDEITSVGDAEAAMRQLEHRSPRIVLCAGRMSPVDGFEFTRRLRRSTTVRDCTVSVVLTIAGPDRRDVISALNAGADSMLPFPMSVKNLGQMLTALDTQKRPFERASTYVGPCRRRGLVTADGEAKRRLEDFGAAEPLGAMMESLRSVYAAAQCGDVAPQLATNAAKSLAAYLTEARGDSPANEAALSAQCQTLIGEFVVHAPGRSTFEHACLPIRRMLTNVVAKSLKASQSAA